MSEQLFDIAAVFTDIHFGKKNNDRQHNVDCENFVDWMIEVSKSRGIKTCIFLGDWHDNRHTIHVSTLNYSLSNIEKLSKNFDVVYFIPGNHDLFYKEKREITSVSFGRNLKNVVIINDFLHDGKVTFCPWLVGDEHKQVKKYAKKSKYIFGHFEIPHFLMNAMVEMPDHGGINSDHFDGIDQWAFSGHFHKRQAKNKICYIGNPFPHNFADAWDDERGFMILEWDKEPEFLKWEGAPKYRTMKMSDLLGNPDEYLDHLTNARINCDINLSHEEIQMIKEIFIAQYNPRKIDISNSAKNVEEYEYNENTMFQTVDQIVIEGLDNIESASIDKTLLINMYNNL